MVSFTKRHWEMMLFFSLLFTVICAVIWWYSVDKIMASGDSYSYISIVAGSAQEQINLGEITSSVKIEQTLSLKDDNCIGVRLMFGTYARTNDSMIIATIQSIDNALPRQYTLL